MPTEDLFEGRIVANYSRQLAPGTTRSFQIVKTFKLRRRHDGLARGHLRRAPPKVLEGEDMGPQLRSFMQSLVTGSGQAMRLKPVSR